MIHITSVVNRPDFVHSSRYALQEVLEDSEYTFHIVDDSVDPEITEHLRLLVQKRT